MTIRCQPECSHIPSIAAVMLTSTPWIAHPGRGSTRSRDCFVARGQASRAHCETEMDLAMTAGANGRGRVCPVAGTLPGQWGRKHLGRHREEPIRWHCERASLATKQPPPTASSLPARMCGLGPALRCVSLRHDGRGLGKPVSFCACEPSSPARVPKWPNCARDIAWFASPCSVRQPRAHSKPTRAMWICWSNSVRCRPRSTRRTISASRRTSRLC